jgi:hypothetical protein
MLRGRRSGSPTLGSGGGATARSSRPIEQPTKFDLVINLTTAKALGITIPRSLPLQANQVIEISRWTISSRRRCHAR